MTTVSEWAWVAGLFEGEGSIYSMDRCKDGHHQLPVMRLSLQMTDRDVVERLFRLVECGGISKPRHDLHHPHRKPTYMWCVSRRSEIERLLVAMLPWFGERRGAKARSTLAEIAKLNMTCVHCGVTFRSHRISSRFCSNKCRSMDYYLAHRGEPSQIGRPRTR